MYKFILNPVIRNTCASAVFGATAALEVANGEPVGTAIILAWCSGASFMLSRWHSADRPKPKARDLSNTPTSGLQL